jgi:hypothetical protein
MLPMPLWTFHHCTVKTPLASSEAYVSARKMAPGWVFWPTPTLVSVRLMPIRPESGPAYFAICCRTM